MAARLEIHFVFSQSEVYVSVTYVPYPSSRKAVNTHFWKSFGLIWRGATRRMPRLPART